MKRFKIEPVWVNYYQNHTKQTDGYSNDEVVLLIRCRHLGENGECLSLSGPMRVGIAIKNSNRWRGMGDRLHRDGHIEHTVTCPECGSTLRVGDKDVQAVLNRLLSWKEPPRKVFIHFVNQRVRELREEVNSH